MRISLGLQKEEPRGTSFSYLPIEIKSATCRLKFDRSSRVHRSALLKSRTQTHRFASVILLSRDKTQLRVRPTVVIALVNLAGIAEVSRYGVSECISLTLVACS